MFYIISQDALMICMFDKIVHITFIMSHQPSPRWMKGVRNFTGLFTYFLDIGGPKSYN